MKNIKIGTKLLIGFGIIIIIFIGMAIFIINEVFGIQENLDTMQTSNQITTLLLEQEVSMLQKEIAVDNYIMSKELDYINMFKKYDEQFEQYMLELERLTTSEETRDKLDQLSYLDDRYDEIFLTQLVPAVDRGNASTIESADQEVTMLEDEMGEIFDYLTELYTAHSEEAYHMAQQDLSEFFIELVVGISITIIVSILIVISLTRAITKPIKEVVNVTNVLAEGNLNVEQLNDHSKDETGQLARAVNKMVENIRQLIQQTKLTADKVSESSIEMSQNAENVNEAAGQIAGAVQEVAQGSTMQVQSSDEVARAMEEMSSGIQRVAEASSTIAESTTTMTDNARDGNTSVEKAISQMDKIKKGTDEATNVIHLLQKDSTEIGEIINMITDISEQTNLLALNAAIEAARAGEAGKGFAVVADEIRKLADQTRQSASKVNVLVTAIQTNTNEAVATMETGKIDVDEGIDVIQKVGDVFNEILTSIEQTSADIQEMSAVAEEMSASSEEVTASVEEMASSAKESSVHTQQVVASVEGQLSAIDQVSTSAVELAKISEDLKRQLNQFKIQE